MAGRQGGRQVAGWQAGDRQSRFVGLSSHCSSRCWCGSDRFTEAACAFIKKLQGLGADNRQQLLAEAAKLNLSKVRQRV